MARGRTRAPPIFSCRTSRQSPAEVAPAEDTHTGVAQIENAPAEDAPAPPPHPVAIRLGGGVSHHGQTT